MLEPDPSPAPAPASLQGREQSRPFLLDAPSPPLLSSHSLGGGRKGCFPCGDESFSFLQQCGKSGAVVRGTVFSRNNRNDCFAQKTGAIGDRDRQSLLSQTALHQAQAWRCTWRFRRDCRRYAQGGRRLPPYCCTRVDFVWRAGIQTLGRDHTIPRSAYRKQPPMRRCFRSSRSAASRRWHPSGWIGFLSRRRPNRHIGAKSSGESIRWCLPSHIAGLVFALLVAVAGLGCAVYLALRDHDVVASVIGGTTLVGLVTAFIAGRRAPPASGK